MKLKGLELTNFKGISSFEMTPNGENVSIFADNELGKTTIADAESWLLCDQDSLGNSLNPKPLEITGEAAHGICSDVEGEFILNDNGDTIILKKSFSEKWTKKHGSAKKIFTGHTTKYSIDGVPNITETNYKKRIGEIAPDQVLKLLTSTHYFSETLHWKDRRSILLDICGDISDKDIIASDKSLSSIPEILAGKTLEEQKKIISSRKTKLNKELSELPIRIDEATKGLPDISGLNLVTIEKEIKSLSKALKEKNEEKVRIESGGEIAGLIKEQRILDGKLLELENEASKSRNKAEKKQREKLSELEGLKSVKEKARNKLVSEIETRAGTNEAAEKEIVLLTKRWHKTNDSVFNEDDTICPTCGQEYPEEKAQEIREAFNTTKAEKLTSINNSGKTVNESIEERKKQNEDDSADIIVYDERIKELVSLIDDLKEPDLVNTKESKESPEQAALKKDIDLIGDKVDVLEHHGGEALAAVQREIDDISDKSINAGFKDSTLKAHKRGQKRIKELSDEQKACATEFESLEEKLFIMEEFIRAKVSLLEEKVNKRFTMANIKLFDIQVNGALSECCEVTYKGIPWSSGLNNSAKINVGLDIINVLSEFYGLTMPVFIDNAESVVKTIESKSQIIKLVVDAKYKKLTVK